VSICLVGAFLGCAVSGSLADKYGRRRAFQLSTVPMIVGAVVRFVIISVSMLKFECITGNVLHLS
jgi:MFS family permease